MPISKIKGSAINDGAITLAKTDNLLLNPHTTGTEGMRLPIGTTGERANATAGDLRFNSTLVLMEYYDGTLWKAIDSPPTVTAVTYPNSQTELGTLGGETLVVAGSNFSTVGTVTAVIDNSALSSLTVNNSNQITLTGTPAKSAGDYILKVTNPSGLSSEFTISYSGTPAWNTAVNTVLVSQPQGSTVNYTALSATDDGDATGVTYSETTSVLSGAGLAINSSTGAITGTLAAITGNTTYTFTLRATDNDAQTTDRQFKITNLVNYFGDGSDGSLST